MGDDQLLHLVGLDFYVMIRYVKLCWKLFAVSTFVCVCILVPVYSAGGEAAKLKCGGQHPTKNLPFFFFT